SSSGTAASGASRTSTNQHTQAGSELFRMLSRRAVLVLPLALAIPRTAKAFGDVGAFDPRVLVAGGTLGSARATAPARWSWELVQRTSAPARLKPSIVRADDPAVVDGPFLWWSGE